MDIAVEGASLSEAKDLLREKLAASDDFSGKWKLWMQVDVDGGIDIDGRWGKEAARCAIDVQYVVELTTGKGKTARRRHGHHPGVLPSPFVGEFTVPTTHKELSQLRDGPAVPAREDWNKDNVWAEATPELVEAVRLLQRRLGESGEAVEAALSKKRFLETLEAVRSGGRLLGAGR